jgi:hypothetical protein
LNVSQRLVFFFPAALGAADDFVFLLRAFSQPSSMLLWRSSDFLGATAFTAVSSATLASS